MPTIRTRKIERLERERNAGRLGLAAYGAACVYRSILHHAEAYPLADSPREKAAAFQTRIDNLKIAREHRL